MKLAEYQDLYYVKKVDFGVYLAEDMGGETHVLLPPKQVLLLTTMTTGSADIRHTTRHLSGQVMTITLLLIMMKITIK